MPIHRPYEIFRDFLGIGAAGLYLQHTSNTEVRTEVQQIGARYTPADLDRFKQLMQTAKAAIKDSPYDFLGNCFHQLELNDKWRGQFFTPRNVAEMMTMMTITSREDTPADDHIVTVLDPSVGGGSMLLAAVKSYGPTQKPNVFYTGMDIDILAFQMTYIQMELAGAATHVIWGNSLTDEVWKTWDTSAVSTHKIYPRLHAQRKDPFRRAG